MAMTNREMLARVRKHGTRAFGVEGPTPDAPPQEVFCDVSWRDYGRVLLRDEYGLTLAAVEVRSAEGVLLVLAANAGECPLSVLADWVQDNANTPAVVPAFFRRGVEPGNVAELLEAMNRPAPVVFALDTDADDPATEMVFEV